MNLDLKKLEKRAERYTGPCNIPSLVYIVLQNEFDICATLKVTNDGIWNNDLKST